MNLDDTERVQMLIDEAIAQERLYLQRLLAEALKPYERASGAAMGVFHDLLRALGIDKPSSEERSRNCKDALGRLVQAVDAVYACGRHDHLEKYDHGLREALEVARKAAGL